MIGRLMTREPIIAAERPAISHAEPRGRGEVAGAQMQREVASASPRLRANESFSFAPPREPSFFGSK